MDKNFRNTLLGRRLSGEDEIKDFKFPENCGDIGLRIDKNGVWYEGKSPIGREEIWKLFASILQLDDKGNYWLVTPYERVAVEVEDVPFMVIKMDIVDHCIVYGLNTGVEITLSAEHPIFLRNETAPEGPRPYIKVRKNLVARLLRSVYYQTLDIAKIDEHHQLYLMSGGEKFILGSALEDKHSET